MLTFKKAVLYFKELIYSLQMETIKPAVCIFFKKLQKFVNISMTLMQGTMYDHLFGWLSQLGRCYWHLMSRGVRDAVQYPWRQRVAPSQRITQPRTPWHPGAPALRPVPQGNSGAGQGVFGSLPCSPMTACHRQIAT